MMDNNSKTWPPLVKGLVIAGGFSRRMGQDKALIRYHDVPQALWTYRLLEAVCDAVWLGCRAEQDLGEANDLPRIHDREPDRGPMEAIAAAFASDPQSAWLVVACDLPRLKVPVLTQLLDQRDPNALATAFRSAYDNLPEPLCTLYEPQFRPNIEDAISRQRGCPRKLLIEFGERIRILDAPENEALDNFNTPQDAMRLQK